MMTFNEKLNEICIKKNSHLCIGLDVDLDKIPSFLLQSTEPLFAFCKSIIDSTTAFAAAFKINTAFFEAYGVRGWQNLVKIIAYLPADVITIADAKRADIGNSSRMYARAFFKELSFDAITINPYLGYDAISPFIEDEAHGVFILCVTSNEGTYDFQHIYDGEKYLFEHVALKTMQWNTKNNCGLVVGATHPAELQRVRHVAPDIPFLIPGIGAQGGDLAMSVKSALNSPRATAIFNSSRGIIYRTSDKSFADRAAKEASLLRDNINKLRDTKKGDL